MMTWCDDGIRNVTRQRSNQSATSPVQNVLTLNSSLLHMKGSTVKTAIIPFNQCQNKAC